MRSKSLSKEKIIDAAEELLRHEGLDGIKVRKLSKATGVAVGTLYNYFSSQDELIEAVFVQSWEKTKIRLFEIKNDTSNPGSKLHLFLKQLAEDVENRRSVGEYVLGKLVFTPTFKNTRFDFFTVVSDMIVEILKESSKYKNKTDEEIGMTAHFILIGLLHINRDKTYSVEMYRKLVEETFI